MPRVLRASLPVLAEEELGKGALEERILKAMLCVPRHFFVPHALAHLAYQDMPLPIGFEKTISQPFMCALMTDLLDPQRHETVLEVGTGLGYQNGHFGRTRRSCLECRDCRGISR